MSPETWRTLVIMVTGSAATTIFQMWLFRWRKREEIPEEMHKDLKQLQKDIVNVRGEVLYLKGRINGKEWRRGESI